MKNLGFPCKPPTVLVSYLLLLPDPGPFWLPGGPPGEGSSWSLVVVGGITRKLGSSLPSSKGRGSKGRCYAWRWGSPARSPPLSELARKDASPGLPGLRWAASAWSYSVCSGTIFSLGSPWAWGSWPGEPFRELTDTSGDWTSSPTQRPDCARRRPGSASVAAWGLGAGSVRRPECFPSPTDKSQSAYLEMRGEKQGWEGKRYMLARKSTEFNPPLSLLVSEQTAHCRFRHIALFSQD